MAEVALTLSLLLCAVITVAFAFWCLFRSFSEPGRSPFDHDGDGSYGGSLPASERGLDALWDQYRSVTGEEPDKRWGERTLRAKIAEASGSEPD